MRITLIVWLVCLICLSLSPFEVKAHLHSMGRFHRLYHLLAFIVTAVLFAWNARTVQSRVSAGIFALGIGIGTEYLEMVKFHNLYEWWDVCTDFAGILIGLLIVSGGQAFLHKRFLSHSRATEDVVTKA